jgi:hypothetical protein
MVLNVNNASNLSNNDLESSSPPRRTHREGSVTTSPSGQFSIKRLGTQAFILWMNAAAAICAMSRMSKAEAIPLNHTPSGKELSNLVNGLQDTNASHNHLSTHQNTSSIRTRLFPRQDPPAATDAPGNPKAVGKDGQFMKTPDGHDVVFDKNNRPVAYIDPDGSPYALSLGQDGKYGYLQTPVNNFVVYDKNINNNPVPADRDGNVITDQRGNPYALQEDGQYQKTPDGCQYFVYDKHNDNTIAPALRHTADVIDYINQHGGTERLKPEKLKKELGDDSGFLDNEKLWKAVLKYDLIDVYEALVGSDNGKTAGITDRPTSDMAVATVASFIALSAIAAKSPHMKMEDLPKITFFENPEAKQETASYTKSGVEVTLHPHPDPVRIGAVMLTELNTVLGGPTMEPELVNQLGAIAEFMATLFTGITTDGFAETVGDEGLAGNAHYWVSGVTAMLSDPDRATGNTEDLVCKNPDFPTPLADRSYPPITPGQNAEGIKTVCRALYFKDKLALTMVQNAFRAVRRRAQENPGENIPKLTGHEAPACIPRTPSPGKPDPKYLSKAELAGITAGAIAGAAAVVALAGGTAAYFVRRNRHGGGDGGV